MQPLVLQQLVHGDSLVGILTAGRRISGVGNTFGTIVSVGSSVASVTTTNAGLNYTNGKEATTNVFGSGSGLQVEYWQC